MKKIFTLLAAFMVVLSTAQTTPSFKTIKLTGTTAGGTNDSVLTIGTDKVVKKVAKSVITDGLATTTQLATKENTITAGTTSQYWRGDKTWQTLDKAAVGLGNVDNTTDAAKPISTATQTALNLKANNSDVVFLAGTQTITGAKTFNTGNASNLTALTVYSSKASTTNPTLLVEHLNTTNGESAGIRINNTANNANNRGLLIQSTAGQSARFLNQGTATGLYISNQSTGDGVVVDATNMSTTGLSFVGQYLGSNTFTVDKTGAVTGTSFVKSSRPATNILLAGGGDIAQSDLSISTATQTALNAKQNTLVSGTSIKTINGNSLLGSGDIVISSGGSTAPLEFNTTDLTVWNNGKGDIATNISFGEEALKVNTTGNNNTAFGISALLNNTTGSSNSAIGRAVLSFNSTGSSNSAIGRTALFANTTGSNNTVIGHKALQGNTTGSNNIAIGFESGNYANGNNQSIVNNSIFIGNTTMALANNQINQIVIGHEAIGAGSNTATLGNTSIVKTVLRGTINTASMPVYADNAAATAGGLAVGDQYRTSTGVLMVRF